MEKYHKLRFAKLAVEIGRAGIKADI